MLKPIVLMSAFFVAGCATTNNEIKGAHTDLDNNNVAKLQVGYKKDYQGEYYALLERVDEKWSVVSTSRNPIRRPNKNSEILAFNKELTYSQPNYDRAPYFNGKTFECSAWGKYEEREEYVPCNSQLTTKNVGKTIGKNTMAAIMTLGLASGSHVEVDNEKMTNAINESGVITQLLKDKEKYDNDNERDRNRIKQMLEENKKVALEAELNFRKSMLSQTKKIGTLICKNDTLKIGNYSSPIEHVGYVERVDDEKIQIRTKYARFKSDKQRVTLANYQESIIWDDALNWLPCVD